MEHADAEGSNAVERYLLDEMTEDEQRIFEEHYFDCSVCGADVTDGTRMMMTGQVVAEADPQPVNRWKPAPKFRWLPQAAAASLIFGLLGGGVGFSVASRHTTALVHVERVETGQSRAATTAKVPKVWAGDELRFDVQPHDDATRYAAVIQCGGERKSANDISRELAAEAISLRIGELPPGRCDLVIEGVRKDGNRFEITSSPFEVGER